MDLVLGLRGAVHQQIFLLLVVAEVERHRAAQVFQEKAVDPVVEVVVVLP